MSPLRSVVAVLAGMMLLNFMDLTLERILVNAVADVVPTDTVSYVAIRNRPLVLTATLVSHTLAATLAGYVVAKIAGAHEMRHAVAAAVALTATFALAFTGENPMLPPVWVRAVILLATPPALLAGASVRAQARMAAGKSTGPTSHLLHTFYF
jgi:hypothetical protein